MNAIARHSIEQLSLVTYAVDDLVTLAAEDNFDSPSNSLSIAPNNHKVFGVNFEEIGSDLPSSYYNESILAELIKEEVLKKKNYHSAKTITSVPGKIFISHYPHVHQEIECFLNQLRELAEIPVRMEGNFIGFKNNFFKQSNLTFHPLHLQNDNSNTVLPYAILDEEKSQEILSNIEGTKDAELIHQDSLYLRQGQSRHFYKQNHTDFLAGEGKSGEGKSGEFIGRMYEGVVVHVKPQINRKSQDITFCLDVCVVTISKPIPAFPTMGGEIAIPNQLVQKVEAKIRVPWGKNLLLAGFANPYEDKGNKSFSPAKKKENFMLLLRAQMPMTA